MPRFTYHANALAVGGRITRPLERQIDPAAACVLDQAGGRVTASAPPFSLELAGEFILSYDGAETTIEGKEASSGIHTTNVVCVLRNLNVLNVLKADEVRLQLALSYDLAADKPSIDSTGSGFVNLTLAGKPLDIALDHAMCREASDYAAFLPNHPECRERHGKIRYSLSRHPMLQFTDPDYGWYHQNNFGRIYFAEWSAAPYTQNLTMLRLALGSPADGDVTVGGGSGNGTPTP